MFEIGVSGVRVSCREKTMKKYWLTLLVTILLFSSNGVYADVFIGDWKLFVTSAGKEISDNQPSIGLGISKAGTFYNVQVELPIIRQTPKTGNFKERGGWGGFLQASQEQQVQYSLAMIRDKYTGKYVLSDDEKTLENINGSVSFKYRKNGEMICSSDIGCFNHGKANMASSPQTENVGDTGTPPASHEGTAGTTPQQGHTGSVMAVNVSPDGKYFTSGSGDKTVKIWNTTTGECVATLLGHLGRVSKTTTLLNGEIVIERSDEGEVRSVSWSPDGKNVASGSVDETVRIWDVSSGEGVGTFAGHSGWVLSVNYSPDGRYVASGSSDKTVKIWNIASGQCIKTLEGHTSAVLSVNYSPDGRYVASGSSDKTIKIWDIASGECVKTLEGHAADVNSVNYSRDGRYIASGSDDKTIKIWDIASGECVKTLEGHVATVNSVSYARNGRYIASGSDDKTIKIWDIASGECVKTLKGTNSVRSISYAPRRQSCCLWKWGQGKDGADFI
jgi:FOG: WD40 repeat